MDQELESGRGSDPCFEFESARGSDPAADQDQSSSSSCVVHWQTAFTAALKEAEAEELE